MGRNGYWQSPDAMRAPLTATTQDEIDGFTNSDVPFLILGGTDEQPLVVRFQVGIPPAVASGASVVVLPAKASHPAAVCVLGKGAHVLGLGNARITCYGESVVTAKQQSKVIMYKGVLHAEDDVRATLFDNAVGHFHGRSKGFCRNTSEAFCYDMSFVYVCHQTHAHVCDDTARIWIRDYTGCSLDLSRRPPDRRTGQPVPSGA